MLRRAALGLIAGAPFAGVAAASGAIQNAPVSASVPVTSDGPSKVWSAFDKERRRRSQYAEVQRIYHTGMHHSVETKRSWSSAFKAHVEAKRRVEEEDLWSIHSESDMLKWLLRKGINT